MHVALIREWFDRMHGGAERYAVNLAQALLERGHRVSVICDRWVEEDARGLSMVRVPFARWLGPFAYEHFAAATAAAARALRADVTLALARSTGGEVCRVGDLLQRAWMDAHWPHTQQRRRLRWAWRVARRMALEERIFRKPPFRRVIVESTLVAGHLRDYFGLEGGRVAIVPNGVDGGRFSPLAGQEAIGARHKLGLPGNALVALFVSMDFRRKGLASAVRGFCEAVRAAGMLAPRMNLLAVGRGDPNIAANVAREYGLGERVRVLPRTPRIEDCYRAADVLLHPSKIDPGANVVLEALSCGVPAIVSANTGYRDAIVPGRNGFVLGRRDDAHEIAARVLDVLAGRESAFAPAAVRGASELLSPRQHVDRVLDILDESAANRSPSGVTHERALS